MQLHKRKLQSIKLQAVLAILAAGIFLLTGCEKEKTQQSAGPPPAPLVAVGTIQPQEITLTTELPGRTSAYRMADIRPQINGLIQERLFTEGAMVKAGDVLYQIDPAPFKAALENAEAALGRAEANLSTAELRVERYKELLADKAVSRQSYDDAMAALAQVKADIAYWKASVKTARINLAYTRITAPISGRIGISHVTEGAIVTAYQPVALATIQQLDPIYVDVPQSTIEQMRISQRMKDGRLNQEGNGQKKVRVIMEDDTVYPLEGTFQFRDITVDPSTGSVVLRVKVPNPDGVLLPNMFVRARIQEGINEQAILIPQQAVSRDSKGNPMALVVEKEDTVAQRMLTLDRAIEDQWLVVSGLSKGDRVIVEGLQKVRPGMSVKVKPFESGMPAGKLKTDPVAPAAETSN